MNPTKNVVVVALVAITIGATASQSFGQLFRNRGGGGGGQMRNSVRRPMMPMPPVPPMIRRSRNANGGAVRSRTVGRQPIRRQSTLTSSGVTYYSTPTVVTSSPSIVTSQSVQHVPATSHQTYRVVSPSPTTARAPAPTPASNATAKPDKQLAEVRQLVKEGRRYFELQRYKDALSVVDRVCELAPNDSNAFQFRSFVHFAMGNFDSAVADAYDALALGDCWDWQAVYDLYGNAATYESQLRELEQFSQSEPSMAGHFLLGYQYVVLGHYDRAKTEFNGVLKTTPGEPLTLKLLDVLTRLESPKAGN